MAADAKMADIMPKGHEDIYIGMPLKDFLQTKRDIKSGTEYMDWIDDGDSPWFKDPNNPRKVDWSRDNHKFVESSKDPIFNRGVTYLFGMHELDSVDLEGAISSRYPEKIKKVGAELIERAFSKWGTPDDILVIEHKLYPAGSEKRLQISYYKGDVGFGVGIPIKWSIPPCAKWNYYCRLMGREQYVMTFGMGVSSIKDSIKLGELSGKKLTKDGRKKLQLSLKVHSRRLLTEDEQDKLLKETGYFEILRQEMEKHRK